MDPPPPLPARHPLFARADWPLVRKKAILYARKLGRSIPDARDLADKAIAACLTDPYEPWNGSQGKLFAALKLSMRRILFNKGEHDDRFPEVRALEDRDEDVADPLQQNGQVLPGGEPSPEADVANAQSEQTYRRRLAALAERMKDDALVTLLVAEMRKSQQEPMEVALAEGFTREDVYTARMRLKRAAEAVLEEDDEEDEEESPPSAEMPS
jgi:hypothetical protein